VPRVLHVCESTEGGVGVFIAELARFQVARGDEVSVAVPSGGPVVARLAEIGARHLPWQAVAAPGPTVPGEMRSLARHVRTVRPDVVHLHSSKAGMVGRLLLRRRRATIMQPHAWSFFAKTGPVRRATLEWERIAARWTDVVLCVSEDERRLGIESGVQAEYRVLPNGVDLDRFRPASAADRAAAREQLGLPGSAPIALCAGRLHRQKNQGALLDVWPRVRAELPDARLVLLGDGPDRGELEARGVEGVVFAGSTGDVRPWLAAASLVVQPSRWEGMSLSLLEALASARSVVVTDVPGMAEVVQGGVGAVVPPDDPEALTRAIVDRLADQARADEEGRAGRRRAEAHHDRRAQHEGVEQLYGEVLERRGERPAAGTARGGGSDRLRVLIVQPYATHGGSESWLLRLLDTRAGGSLDVSVVLLQDGPFRAELERRGIPVTLRPVGNNPVDLLAPAGWLARQLRRDRPDVVLGNVMKAQMVAGPAGLVAGVPTVWAKHDHGYDRVLAVPVGRVSTRVIGAVEELAAPTRRKDAVIIPPPRPDRDPAGRDDARAAMRDRGIPLDDRPALAMAGRLVPFKGVDDAIEALAQPPARDWMLVVAGVDDPSAPGETDRLRALAQDRGVADRVHFAGQVPEVSHWLAAFDALAVLTKPGARRAPKSEGFGTSAFEAMLAGIPVIATGEGAVTRRLDGGRAGAAVPAGDPAAVAEALGRYADPQARAAAGQAAREIVAGHPTAEECAQLLVDVLRDAARS
jgi:glycosyltransferase involved in cell wall biosynthesis